MQPLEIDLDKTPMRDNSVLSTALRIVNAFKDRAGASPDESVVIRGGTVEQRGAITQILNLAYMLSLPPNMQAEMMRSGGYTHIENGICKVNIGGAMFFEVNPEAKMVTVRLAKQKGEFPAYQVERTLTLMRDQSFRRIALEDYPSVRIRDEKTGLPDPHNYIVHFCANLDMVDMTVGMFSSIARAHDLNPEHIVTFKSGIQTDKGKFPAVLVREDVFAKMLETEKAPEPGRGRG